MLHSDRCLKFICTCGATKNRCPVCFKGEIVDLCPKHLKIANQYGLTKEGECPLAHEADEHEAGGIGA